LANAIPAFTYPLINIDFPLSCINYMALLLLQLGLFVTGVISPFLRDDIILDSSFLLLVFDSSDPTRPVEFTASRMSFLDYLPWDLGFPSKISLLLSLTPPLLPRSTMFLAPLSPSSCLPFRDLIGEVHRQSPY